MNNANDPEQDQLNRLLLDSLSPIELSNGRHNALKQGLLTRAAQSVANQAGVLTVRAKDGVWQTLKAGTRVKQLWNGDRQGNSVLVEFAPGASLIPHRHNCLEEGIVLRGDLQMGDLRLGPLDYHASPAGSRHGGISSNQGALAYLRGTSLGNAHEVLLEVLGGLLPFGQDRSLTVYADNNSAWQEIMPGIWKKPLWQEGPRESCFYRLEANARCPEHLHQVEEECMMLDGDLFIDDVLLRAGDYQLAPAGSLHREVYTDVGATLFVRGAREY
ncbi:MULTISPECIES: cupin domain-containing protein [Methylomonas]|nr:MULTISPECIES: cupin domain-containing protein [Methylomonas]TCV85618.1 ChrR-like protein with cupin domain [Methylomonas methanica]